MEDVRATINRAEFSIIQGDITEQATDAIVNAANSSLMGGGGVMNLLNSGIGMAAFTLALGAYPILDFLERAVTSAGIPVWLVAHLGFIQVMLPEVFQDAANLIVGMTAL